MRHHSIKLFAYLNLSIDAVVTTCCNVLDINKTSLINEPHGKKRNGQRQFIYYLAYNFTRATDEQIGKYFGRSTATIVLTRYKFDQDNYPDEVQKKWEQVLAELFVLSPVTSPEQIASLPKERIEKPMLPKWQPQHEMVEQIRLFTPQPQPKTLPEPYQFFVPMDCR